jgi:SNF2 family DNA or RNA helicase
VTVKQEDVDANSALSSSAGAGALSLHSQAEAQSLSSVFGPVMPKAEGDPDAPGASASGALRLPRADWEDVKRLRIKGEGQIGSKIEACVKYIKYLHTADASVQVLVFSQFPRVLSKLGLALAVNGIGSQQLLGTPEQRAARIQEFQQPDACTALLMGLRHDNHGLTLVNATAVFLLEPSLNASIEAQAVKRVHRIGQGRECHVYKLLMRDSIEESIDALARREHAIEAGTGVAAANNNNAAEVAASADALLQSSSKEAMNVKQLLQLMKVDDEAAHAAAFAAESIAPSQSPIRSRSTGSRRSTGSGR